MSAVSAALESTGRGRPGASAAPTVVLADDHPPIRLGVRMALMRGGFRVLAEAADGDGAVDAVLRERPDLCLLDVRMPGVGGVEAAEQMEKSRLPAPRAPEHRDYLSRVDLETHVAQYEAGSTAGSHRFGDPASFQNGHCGYGSVRSAALCAGSVNS